MTIDLYASGLGALDDVGVDDGAALERFSTKLSTIVRHSGHRVGRHRDESASS